ncbi:Lectin-receptor kinase [Quillaja saponaria]|uniref:non-specific serine/threonine protein kinase n=1 Tax=Quillaja saponaria TaxID=32244 RepID=A0AAD7PAG0_QUISA|nr:Lectin-receptor kinase [Quillaja saponaria]
MDMLLTSLFSVIVQLFSIILLVLAQDENQFIYNGFHQANLQLDGSAKILSNGLLQLTNTSKQQTGHAFYRLPLKFNTSSSSTPSLSFSTNFIFAMVPVAPSFGGQGMAFTISPSTDFSQATSSPYIGLFNSSNLGLSSNHVLAIELDPVKNPQFNDRDENHVGIDVNSLESVNSAPASYIDQEGKNTSLKLLSGNAMHIWIDYDEAEKLLNVSLALTKNSKPKKPLLSTRIDLSPVLLDFMYVGFSASTGTLASDQYILGWSFSKIGQAENLEISKLPRLPSQKKSEEIPVQLLIVLLSAVTVVLITIISVAYIIRRKKYEEIHEDWEIEYGPHRFSYKNLYKATKGFKDKELLGTGGFGKVYRGKLPAADSQIAVKRVSHDSRQGLKEFVAEIVSMGRLGHRNLVQLLGYCRRKGELLLVYDYMHNGSLDKFLYSNEKPNLHWSQRYQILRGVASALLYLHEEWEQVVLHRDIKASNVLLDADLNGRLGDFGLARLYDHGTNPQTTHVVGTVGYLAPELSRTGKATTSTDVFAYGAFILEVACGRRPIQHQAPDEETILVDWVFDCWKRGEILNASDPRLEGDYAVEEMELVLKLGMLCSQSKPESRPSMRQVMQYLDCDAVLPEISSDSANINMFLTGEEASRLIMSFPSSFEQGSTHSFSSSDSILIAGR